MSHKTSINTKISNKESLKNALNKLNINFVEGDLKTKGNYGVHEDVDILLKDYNGTNLNDAVGFKKQKDGNYQFTGDFYGLYDNKGKTLNEKNFTDRVTNAYNFEELNSKLGSMGFISDSTNLDFTQNQINFVMQRTV